MTYTTRFKPKTISVPTDKSAIFIKHLFPNLPVNAILEIVSSRYKVGNFRGEIFEIDTENTQWQTLFGLLSNELNHSFNALMEGTYPPIPVYDKKTNAYIMYTKNQVDTLLGDLKMAIDSKKTTSEILRLVVIVASIIQTYVGNYEPTDTIKPIMDTPLSRIGWSASITMGIGSSALFLSFFQMLASIGLNSVPALVCKLFHDAIKDFRRPDSESSNEWVYLPTEEVSLLATTDPTQRLSPGALAHMGIWCLTSPTAKTQEIIDTSKTSLDAFPTIFIPDSNQTSASKARAKLSGRRHHLRPCIIWKKVSTSDIDTLLSPYLSGISDNNLRLVVTAAKKALSLSNIAKLLDSDALNNCLTTKNKTDLVVSPQILLVFTDLSKTISRQTNFSGINLLFEKSLATVFNASTQGLLRKQHLLSSLIQDLEFLKQNSTTNSAAQTLLNKIVEVQNQPDTTAEFEFRSDQEIHNQTFSETQPRQSARLSPLKTIAVDPPTKPKTTIVGRERHDLYKKINSQPYNAVVLYGASYGVGKSRALNDWIQNQTATKKLPQLTLGRHADCPLIIQPLDNESPHAFWGGIITTFGPAACLSFFPLFLLVSTLAKADDKLVTTQPWLEGLMWGAANALIQCMALAARSELSKDTLDEANSTLRTLVNWGAAFGIQSFNTLLALWMYSEIKCQENDTCQSLIPGGYPDMYLRFTFTAGCAIVGNGLFFYKNDISAFLFNTTYDETPQTLTHPLVFEISKDTKVEDIVGKYTDLPKIPPQKNFSQPDSKQAGACSLMLSVENWEELSTEVQACLLSIKKYGFFYYGNRPPRLKIYTPNLQFAISSNQPLPDDFITIFDNHTTHIANIESILTIKKQDIFAIETRLCQAIQAQSPGAKWSINAVELYKNIIINSRSAQADYRRQYTEQVVLYAAMYARERCKANHSLHKLVTYADCFKAFQLLLTQDLATDESPISKNLAKIHNLSDLISAIKQRLDTNKFTVKDYLRAPSQLITVQL